MMQTDLTPLAVEAVSLWGIESATGPNTASSSLEGITFLSSQFGSKTAEVDRQGLLDADRRFNAVDGTCDYRWCFRWVIKILDGEPFTRWLVGGFCPPPATFKTLLELIKAIPYSSLLVASHNGQTTPISCWVYQGILKIGFSWLAGKKLHCIWSPSVVWTVIHGAKNGAGSENADHWPTRANIAVFN